MDQYLTTYKKDYPWPATRYKHRIALLKEYDSCKCHDRPREVKPLVRCGDDYDWSRTGPMGRLLDPKLHPAKTGPHPETEATRFDQPATYMRKSTPIDEVIKRVDEDRLKTTYQLDYSEKATALMDKPFTEPCVTKQEEVKDIDCRPSAKVKLLKITSQVDKERTDKKKVSKTEDEETRLLPWRSEYQDTVSKLGHSIMKYQIHHSSSTITRPLLCKN
ncbi:hypothetical protein QLX08_003668 [Tetragonisca angustula]|uniref:Uncharacterized protein n=1 Tax=Tetragonisca angustula TaxID=166442 RepID=A0AAW1A894_9HYME